MEIVWCLKWNHYYNYYKFSNKIFIIKYLNFWSWFKKCSKEYYKEIVGKDMLSIFFGKIKTSPHSYSQHVKVCASPRATSSPALRLQLQIYRINSKEWLKQECKAHGLSLGSPWLLYFLLACSHSYFRT